MGGWFSCYAPSCPVVAKKFKVSLTPAFEDDVMVCEPIETASLFGKKNPHLFGRYLLKFNYYYYIYSLLLLIKLNCRRSMKLILQNLHSLRLNNSPPPSIMAVMAIWWLSVSRIFSLPSSVHTGKSRFFRNLKPKPILWFIVPSALELQH